VTDYHHFDQNPRPNQAGGPSASKCPLYDNVEERHEREVKQAQQTAAKQAREDNPDLVDQDLEIEISDAAQKSTKERARRNRMLLAGGLYGVDEDEEDHADGSDEEFEVARDRLRAERLRRQQYEPI
jgi:TRIAD3 protein (E3 ubiquitin-protein ligase RNF216)